MLLADSDRLDQPIRSKVRGVKWSFFPPVSGFTEFTTRWEWRCARSICVATSTSRPGKNCSASCLGDLVGLRRCDVLLGREGLDVVVEPGAAGLAVQVLGGQEALIGQIRHAVDAGEVAGAVCVHSFLLLGHVPQDTAHGTCGLLLLTDEAARRHGIPPALPLSGVR